MTSKACQSLLSKGRVAIIFLDQLLQLICAKTFENHKKCHSVLCRERAELSRILNVRGMSAKWCSVTFFQPSLLRYIFAGGCEVLECCASDSEPETADRFDFVCILVGENFLRNWYKDKLLAFLCKTDISDNHVDQCVWGVSTETLSWRCCALPHTCFPYGPRL